jgi:hypothetical protein
VVAATGPMTEILRFLIEHLRFLYETGRYRFVDSMADHGFGGQGVLFLESDRMKVKLVREREVLFIELGSVEEKGKFDWYGIGVVRRVLGDDDDVDELTPKALKDVRRRRAKRCSASPGASARDNAKVLLTRTGDRIAFSAPLTRPKRVR